MTIIPGGLWFKNHCLKITPNKKNGGVRYRYPGEDWITVDGDDYSIEQQEGQCDTTYYLYAEATYQGIWLEKGLDFEDTVILKSISQVFGRILNVVFQPRNGFNPLRAVVSSNITGYGYYEMTVDFNLIFPDGEESNRVYLVEYSSRQYYESNNVTFKYGIKNPGNEYLVRSDNQADECGSCEFKIYKQGELVLTETRESCPEVELLTDECISNDEQNIRLEIETTPLGFIDVTRSEADSTGSTTGAIPDECVNIYQVNVIQQLFGRLGNQPDLNYTFYGQYCSDIGCEPPTVERDGDDCGESCPDGTCPFYCGNHVCCHDPDTGQAVYQIAIENYAGGN